MELRRWLWLRLTFEGRAERRAAAEWRKMNHRHMRELFGEDWRYQLD